MNRSKISILTLVLLIFAVAPRVYANEATKERLEVWVGNNQGQTLDEARSFVVVACDDTGTVDVVGHLRHTDQSGQTLNVAVKEDGADPFVVPDVSFVPNHKGNGNFHFSLDGFTPGPHDLVVEIQNYGGFPGVNLYFNESANNSGAAPGVPFVCPQE
jgi:hypothetical protein